MISLVYACMNRENNLIESISSWIEEPYISEFIIVDWSSTIPLIENNYIKNLVYEKKIKLIRVDGEKVFSLSKAYNLAFSIASHKIILKCDTDYKNINSSWMKHLVFDNNQLNNYFITGDYLFSKSLTGFLLINKSDFVGYNENFEGWGYDDIDLYNRIQKNNIKLKQIIFFNIKDYIHHIPHSEQSRTENYAIKNKLESLGNNKNKSNSHFCLSKYRTILSINYYQILERIKNDNHNL